MRAQLQRFAVLPGSLTEHAQRALDLAQGQARTVGHGYVGPEHVLLALIESDGGRASIALRSLDVLLEDVQQRVRERYGSGRTRTDLQLPFSPGARTLLNRAAVGARRLGHSRVGTAHLLLPLASTTGGIAMRLFYDYRLDVRGLHDAIARRTGDSSEDEGPPAWGDVSSDAVLDAFTDPDALRGPTGIGWRARAIALAALGSAALSRRAFSPKVAGLANPLGMQVLLRLCMGPEDEPADGAGELADSLRTGLACEQRELQDALENLADARLIVIRDEQDQDQRLLITEAGTVEVERWLATAAPLFHGWPPEHPGADDAVE